MRIDGPRIQAEAHLRGYMTERESQQMRAYISVPAPEEDVPPSLRFCLTEAAIEQGQEFMRHLDSVCFAGPTDPTLADRLVRLMHESWPLVAAADRTIGGLISEVIRKAVRTRGQLPAWTHVARGLSIGHPQAVEERCIWLLRQKEAGRTYDEEVVDPYAMRASENVRDREASDTPLRAAPPVKSLRAARRAATAPDPFAAGARVLESCDDMPFWGGIDAAAGIPVTRTQRSYFLRSPGIER